MDLIGFFSTLRMTKELRNCNSYKKEDFESGFREIMEKDRRG